MQEHLRIPFALIGGTEVCFPNEALYGVSVTQLRCPACKEPVSLSSVGGELALKHRKGSPACLLTGKEHAKDWVRHSAIFHLFGQLKRHLQLQEGKRIPFTILRRCYTCSSLRSSTIPSEASIVQMDYRPDDAASSIKPAIVIISKQMHPLLSFYVATEADGKVDVPEVMRKSVVFIARAETILGEFGSVRIERSYGIASPQCPCEKASRIQAQPLPEGRMSVACPMKPTVAAGGKSGIVTLGACRACNYHLDDYANKREQVLVICGYDLGIRKPPRAPAPDASAMVGKPAGGTPGKAVGKAQLKIKETGA